MIPEHRPTRLPVFLASTLSKIYALGINHQNKKYDHSKGVTTLDRTVISIGNLSAGGTGKTPLVQHVAKTLIAAGHHPAIAMRGYKSKPNQISDEQQEHITALQNTPIVAQPDRTAGLKALFASDEGSTINAVILDDGFQHRKIARDYDIVVIDASRPPYNDALLPLGFLRELPASLTRANAIVITHAEMVEQNQLGNLRRWLDQHLRPATPVAVTQHTWTQILEYKTDSGSPNARPVQYLNGKPVSILTAIGNPEAFATMAKDAGAIISHSNNRPDHDPLSDTLLSTFSQQAKATGATAILTSNKDWSKLKSRYNGGNSPVSLPVLVASLGLKFRSGQQDFDSGCLALFNQ